MVKHVVMWKFKENEEEKVKIFLEKLEELKNVIPEIESIETGINEKKENEYTAILISEFQTYEDLEKYQNHPKHKEVGKLCKEIKIARQAIDYEY